MYASWCVKVSFEKERRRCAFFAISGGKPCGPPMRNVIAPLPKSRWLRIISAKSSDEYCFPSRSREIMCVCGSRDLASEASSFLVSTSTLAKDLRRFRNSFSASRYSDFNLPIFRILILSI